LIGGGRVLFVGVVEDGGDHNDQVLDVSDPVKEVGGNPGKVLISKVAAGEDVDDGRLVLLVDHVGNTSRGLELQVGDEVVPQDLRLLLNLHQI